MIQPPVILFDGICNLCCAWVQFLIRKDKKMKFKFASLQSDAGNRFLHSVGLTDRIPETVVYIKGNHFFLESTAVLEILKDIGGIWKLFVLLKVIPKIIRDSIYRFIAKKRYLYFGKRASCLLPTPENQKRFLT